MCPLQLFIKQTHHFQTPFSTPRSSCRGSSNWNGARGTPIPCPWPEQLPPAETAGAPWAHELDSPLAAPRKINLNLRQPICSTPICTKLSPLCTWGQSSGSAIAHRSLRSLGHWAKFAAAIWFCIMPWSDGGVPLPGSCFRTDWHKSETKAARKAGVQGSFLLFSG